LAGGLGIARSAHAQGSDLMRIALVGCGGRGNGAAGDCLQNCQNVKLVAVADAFENRARGSAERLKKRFGDKVDIPPDRVFSGMDAYRKALASGVDMMINASPPGFRPMQYKAAIEAGKHVFMEKPCCVDAPGFRSLMATNKLADQKGLKVGVGLQRHHQRNYVETIKRIRDGALGKLKFLRAYWNGGGVWQNPDGTAGHKREALAEILGRTPSEMEYQVYNWYFFVWLSGDHITEQHVHNLDVCNWIMGTHPVEANGMGGRQVRKGPGVGHIYDHHFIEFTYADGTKMFSQCRHIRNCWGSVSEAAHGTTGASNCAGRILGENPWSFRGKVRRPYDQEHVDLMDAIRSDKKYNEGWHGATSSFTSVLGRMATYSGKVVKWDDAVAKGPSEMPKSLAWDADPPVMPDKNELYEHAVAMPGLYKPY
jgi:predicted dehydrogenase